MCSAEANHVGIDKIRIANCWSTLKCQEVHQEVAELRWITEFQIIWLLYGACLLRNFSNSVYILKVSSLDYFVSIKFANIVK